MRKLTIFTCLFIATIMIVGCGTQNEYLSKGKEWVKSDKRGRIARAVAQFELAIEREPDKLPRRASGRVVAEAVEEVG